MRSLPTRLKIVLCVVVGCALGAVARDSSAAASPSSRGDSVRLAERIAVPVDAVDLGPADLSAPLDRTILVLTRSPEADARLQSFLEAQQDPASAEYHRWLAPAEFGRRFGISDDEVAKVSAWLEQQGLTVDEIGQGRGWINVSGPVSRVESAFGTRIHTFSNAEGERPVRIDSLTVPREISGLVAGIASLGSASRRPMSRRTPAARSLAYSGGGSADRALAPEDFATIYGVAPLHAAGVTASGVTIAIAGRTEIAVADVAAFRKLFGLPANDPVIVRNGTSPGNLGGYEEFEADLDVEWSGAIAPNAAVKLVVSGSTAATDGVDLSAQYIVDQNLAPIVSVSFGNCEAEMGTAASALYKNLWAQAAAQGMTVFVASMDSGASGCSIADDPEGSGRAVSGLCTTPNDVCVGGTQFDDHGDPGRYWADSSDTRFGSALSYIPEAAWNESGKTPGGSGLWSTGGGTSTLFSQPTWQQGVPGVSAVGRRQVPDISFAAAGSIPYLIIQGASASSSGLFGAEGTSVSTPAMAGIMALIVHKTGQRQGNINPNLYRLGANQFANGGAAVFHDIVEGDNSVPGVTGYSSGAGYDQTTGLGSLDAAALAANWEASPSSSGGCATRRGGCLAPAPTPDPTKVGRR